MTESIREHSADQLERLIEALHAQTAALSDLAESNHAIVDMLIAQEAEQADEDRPPETLLDGTPAT